MVNEQSGEVLTITRSDEMRMDFWVVVINQMQENCNRSWGGGE